MQIKTLPLQDMTIATLYGDGNNTYEIPIYQRNYAWEKDEITALVQDVNDAWTDGKENYYIGTLVTYAKGDGIFEVIDGQQRLTTIKLVLKALQQLQGRGKEACTDKSKLTYRARTKSSNALAALPGVHEGEDGGSIKRGFDFAKVALTEIVGKDSGKYAAFEAYFLNHVRIIHYEVPKDIDLNHYFEIMNSRGEQLEKHEIMKARLMNVLDEADRPTFNRVWEACSDLRAYIQQKYPEPALFGQGLTQFCAAGFDALPRTEDPAATSSIRDLISLQNVPEAAKEKTAADTFQPIIDFPNFLLIVLKLTLLRTPAFCAKGPADKEFRATDIKLDDKELIDEFKHTTMSKDFAKQFAYNLLKARYLLDNYMVHQDNSEETNGDNPWKLQCWQKDVESVGENGSITYGHGSHPRSLVPKSEDKENLQDNLVHLLSMFEVSFTARQRKNYLLYCLLYLFEQMEQKTFTAKGYTDFAAGLAKKYLLDVYLDSARLSGPHVPLPGSFDACLLPDGKLNLAILHELKPADDMPKLMQWFGTKESPTDGVPLFVFNYLDYKIWSLYDKTLRGKEAQKGSDERNAFFALLGCSDFDLDPFLQFHFSRTRRSLEHYYPQALATGENGAPTQTEINCLGNYAMISSDANSAGSNWAPHTKIDHYLNNSKRINPLGVASPKFRVMLQRCKDNNVQHPEQQHETADWNFAEMQTHQKKMIVLLLG